MATQADVRRIALSLPGATEGEDRFAFSVRNGNKDKGFAWVWLERIDPKKARCRKPKVLAVRVADEGEKSALIASDPEKFFTEPHYNGYPAVLIRLPTIRVPRAARADHRRVALHGAARRSSPSSTRVRTARAEERRSYASWRRMSSRWWRTSCSVCTATQRSERSVARRVVVDRSCGPSRRGRGARARWRTGTPPLRAASATRAGILLGVAVVLDAFVATHRRERRAVGAPRLEHPLALHEQHVAHVAAVLERRPDVGCRRRVRTSMRWRRRRTPQQQARLARRSARPRSGAFDEVVLEVAVVAVVHRRGRLRAPVQPDRS